jgi:hypothetical protein
MKLVTKVPLKKIVSNKFKHLIIIGILALRPWVAHSQSTVNIRGHYDETRFAYNKPSGDILHVAFAVTLSTNTCRICATNANDAKVWEVVVYDGTNTYLLTPYPGHFVKPKEQIGLCGLVVPGRQYYYVNKSLLHTYIPWIAYCLRPDDIVPDRPSPVSSWRENIDWYGFRWKDIKSSPDQRFMQAFSIVRDTSLDLDDKQEYLRPTFEHPLTLDALEEQKDGLLRRKSIPDGWVGRTYVCTNWYQTNGFTIPADAEFKLYTYSAGKTLITLGMTIKAEKITFASDDAEVSVPPLSDKTYVRDYRYTRRSENRMFRYAEYVGTGSWKSDKDADLLAKANSYMKHGPKFGDYGLWTKFSYSEDSGRLIVIWLALLLVSAVAIAMLVRGKLKQRQKTQ